MKKLTSLLTLAAAGLFYALPTTGNAADEKTVKGEILDLTCYVDHGGSGEKHSGCAKKCIANGLPVGIKGDDGKVYLVVGDHKPLNKELAESAGKVVTLKGTVAEKDGITMLHNAEVVK